MGTVCKLALITTLGTLGVSGQRLYRQEMDAAARQAMEAIQKVDSKSLFDSMLANLSAQSRHDFDTTFSGIRREARDRIQQWNDWCAVHAEVVRVMTRAGYAGLKVQDLLAAKTEDDLRRTCGELLVVDEAAPEKNGTEADWKKRLEEIATARDGLQAQIQGLREQPALSEPVIGALLSRLADIAEIEAGLAQISGSTAGKKLARLSETASLATAIVNQLSEAYREYKERRDAVNQVRAELAELKVEMLKVALQKLAAEEDHLKRLLAIEVRRAKELQDAAQSFEQYREAILCEKQQDADLDLRRIEDSLKELGARAAAETVSTFSEYRLASLQLAGLGKPEAERLRICRDNPAPAGLRVARLSRALYQAAAVRARGSTPAVFAELRRAQEEQRYSIVRSAVEARSYETLVSTGVRRLAILHAGGIKPGQVAQLVYQAAQLAGIGVIAAKQ